MPPAEAERPEHAVAPVPSDVPDLLSTADRTIVDLRGLGPFLSLGRYRYLAAQDPLPAQIHPNVLVLALPVRSRFDFVVDDEVVSIEPGELIRIRPGSAYVTGVGAQPRGELVWLLLESLPTDSTSADENLAAAIGSLIEADAAVHPAPELTLALLTRALADPDDVTTGTRAWRRSLCSAALLELVHGARQAQDAAPIHPGLRRALTWIDEHIEEPIVVADLIDSAEMSTTHFYDQFARTFGTSPKDYVLRAKVEHAQQLLEAHADSVSHIAHSLGFSSSQHFGTAFRRYVGMSPTQYRTLARSYGGPPTA